jgi:hypothetical protein
MNIARVRLILLRAAVYAGRRDQVQDGDVLEHLRLAHVRALREACPTLTEESATMIATAGVTNNGNHIGIDPDVFANMLQQHAERS